MYNLGVQYEKMRWRLKRQCNIDSQLNQKAYPFKERWLHPQVFGHHVKAEEVSVNSSSSHSHSIKVLVPLGSQSEEMPALFLRLSNQIPHQTFTESPQINFKFTRNTAQNRLTINKSEQLLHCNFYLDNIVILDGHRKTLGSAGL